MGCAQGHSLGGGLAQQSQSWEPSCRLPVKPKLLAQVRPGAAGGLGTGAAVTPSHSHPPPPPRLSSETQVPLTNLDSYPLSRSPSPRVPPGAPASVSPTHLCTGSLPFMYHWAHISPSGRSPSLHSGSLSPTSPSRRLLACTAPVPSGSGHRSPALLEDRSSAAHLQVREGPSVLSLTQRQCQGAGMALGTGTWPTAGHGVLPGSRLTGGGFLRDDEGHRTPARSRHLASLVPSLRLLPDSRQALSTLALRPLRCVPGPPTVPAPSPCRWLRALPQAQP